MCKISEITTVNSSTLGCSNNSTKNSIAGFITGVNNVYITLREFFSSLFSKTSNREYNFSDKTEQWITKNKAGSTLSVQHVPVTIEYNLGASGSQWMK